MNQYKALNYSVKFILLILLSMAPLLTLAGGKEGIFLYQNRQYQEAFYAFQFEAKLGLIQSQYNLAVMNYSGKFVKQDRAEALAWIQLATKSAKKKAVKRTGNPKQKNVLLLEPKNIGSSPIKCAMACRLNCSSAQSSGLKNTPYTTATMQ